MRAVCYAPYHPREGWNLSARTRAADARLLRGLLANCLLTWRPVTEAELTMARALGVYLLPQVVYTPPLLSVFVDGNEAPVPVYVSPDNRRGLHDASRDLASMLKGNPDILALSLGNDYAWTALSSNLGFSYGAFDDLTVTAFRNALKKRFASVEQFNDLVNRNDTSLDDVFPPISPNPSPLYWEWWQFMRDAFAEYLRAGLEGARSVGSTTPVTYATPCGRQFDPASERTRLPFLDIVSGNIFYDLSQDWGTFCATMDRLICAARGRPFLLTETGVHTLHVDDARSTRLLKQSIACALLHPELAGIGVYEFCDEWQLRGKADVHDDTSRAEWWGLVTADRVPKATYQAVAEMFGLIARYEPMFQEWQSPPVVFLSQQDLDWWKVGGTEGSYHERVAKELYRQGVSFRMLDSDALLELDPQRHPRLILCDSYLGAEPDGSNDVLGRVVSYVSHGGNLLYISRMPWQRVYARTVAPDALRPSPERAPISTRYGDGHFTGVPTYDLQDTELRHVLADYLSEALHGRPVTAVEPADKDGVIFWRVFQYRTELWLLLVNVGPTALARVNVRLDPGLSSVRAALAASDGAALQQRAHSLILADLNTYALVSLGPAPQAAPASATGGG